MTSVNIDDQLARAVELRNSGNAEAARDLLSELNAQRPDDPQVNLQSAWTHDKLGLEKEAVPFYERALELGLAGDDLRHALLGLGSTYRALGEYEKSKATLTRGVEAFPDDRGLQVFLAMALYNKGRAKEACEILLRLLSETTAADDILVYRAAIDEYTTDLDRIWS
jgi:tetratricopeptide (TPR) repeat protein